MNKRIAYFIVFAALLFSSFQPTVNVLAAAEKTASLDGLSFVPGKGWAVVFSITGKWRQGDLRGNTMSVGGKSIDLYCNFRDAGHISCTMESLALYIGQNATIYFGGQTFSDIVPARHDNGTGFAECPSDGYESVSIKAYDVEQNEYAGGISYPADMFTIQQAAEQWVSYVESAFSIDIVSYQITGVTCAPPQ